MEPDRHKVVVAEAEAEGWVVPMQLDPAESVYVPSAVGKRSTQPDNPAISKNAPTVVRAWYEGEADLNKKGEWLCLGEMEPARRVLGR